MKAVIVKAPVVEHSFVVRTGGDFRQDVHHSVYIDGFGIEVLARKSFFKEDVVIWAAP